jgi:hypothetical protein
MKRYFFLIIVCIISLPVLSQEHVFDSYHRNSENKGSHNKIKTNVNFVSSFTSFSKGESYVSTYAIPKINYQLNPKLNVSMGVIIGGNNFPYYDVDLNNSGDLGNHPRVFRNRQYLMGGTSYQVSDKLLISGSYIGEMSDLKGGYEEYNLNINYQLTDNINFQAIFRMQKNIESSPFYNPYGFYPYGNQYHRGIYY